MVRSGNVAAACESVLSLESDRFPLPSRSARAVGLDLRADAQEIDVRESRRSDSYASISRIE